jgi:hypothetical protein
VALPPVGDLPCLEVLEVKELRSVERIDGMFCAKERRVQVAGEDGVARHAGAARLGRCCFR